MLVHADRGDFRRHIWILGRFVDGFKLADDYAWWKAFGVDTAVPRHHFRGDGAVGLVLRPCWEC